MCIINYADSNNRCASMCEYMETLIITPIGATSFPLSDSWMISPGSIFALMVLYGRGGNSRINILLSLCIAQSDPIVLLYTIHNTLYVSCEKWCACAA